MKKTAALWVLFIGILPAAAFPAPICSELLAGAAISAPKNGTLSKSRHLVYPRGESGLNALAALIEEKGLRIVEPASMLRRTDCHAQRKTPAPR